MPKPICFIFGAGEHFGPPPVPAPGDLVVAADGGFAYLEQYGLAPDLVVGDFDSLPKKPPSGVQTVVLPKEKDDTDMAAALREGWRWGYRVFHIYGGTGGRLDHTLANIQCVADLAQRGGTGFLFDRDTVITAIHNGEAAIQNGGAAVQENNTAVQRNNASVQIENMLNAVIRNNNGRITFPAAARGIVSVFAHTDICAGVFERGLKYPLADATLYNTRPLGVSNEFTGTASEISVREGTLIVFYPRGIHTSD